MSQAECATDDDLFTSTCSDIIDLDDITKTDKAKRIQYSPTKAAHVVCANLPLVMTETSKDVWIYTDGIYKPDGTRIVDKALCEAGDDLITNSNLSETLRRTRNNLLDNPVVLDANPFLFPTYDGIIELKTGKFRGYSPEDYLTFKYDCQHGIVDADYDLFLWFLCTCLPDPEDVLTVIDIITATAIRIPFEVFVLLIGGGGNGKGILEKVMIALFTLQRSSALTLAEMKRSRFGPGSLLNKDLWIVTEVESIDDATSVIKKVSSGELLDSDVKYGDRVQGSPHLIPILDANEAIDFQDTSRGLARRFIKLDFPYDFGSGPTDRPEDLHIKDKLTTSEVLAGIAHMIAARAPGLIQEREIHTRKEHGETAEEYKRQQYHLYYFCEECLEFCDECPEFGSVAGPRLPVSDIYDEYVEYCVLFSVPTPADNVSLGRYVAKKFGISSKTSHGTRYYPDIRFKLHAKGAFAEHRLEWNSYAGKRDCWGDVRIRGHNTETTDEGTQTNGAQIIGTEKEQILYPPFTMGGGIGNRGTVPYSSLLSYVVDRINVMYYYIRSCKNVRDISYEKFVGAKCRSLRSSVPEAPADVGYEGNGGFQGCSQPHNQSDIRSRATSSAVPESLDGWLSECERTGRPLKPDDEAINWNIEEQTVCDRMARREWIKGLEDVWWPPSRKV